VFFIVSILVALWLINAVKMKLVVVDREDHDYDLFVVALWTFLKYT
jgi:hypothetical protein